MAGAIKTFRTHPKKQKAVFVAEDRLGGVGFYFAKKLNRALVARAA
jgi:hypothetical protein